MVLAVWESIEFKVTVSLSGICRTEENNFSTGSQLLYLTVIIIYATSRVFIWISETAYAIVLCKEQYKY